MFYIYIYIHPAGHPAGHGQHAPQVCLCSTDVVSRWFQQKCSPAVRSPSSACSEWTPFQVSSLPSRTPWRPIRVLQVSSLPSRTPWRPIRVRPDVLRLLLTDLRLGLRVLLGPWTPYRFRLSGPGRWGGARQDLLTQWERVLRPLRTREAPEAEAAPAPQDQRSPRGRGCAGLQDQRGPRG